MLPEPKMVKAPGFFLYSMVYAFWAIPLKEKDFSTKTRTTEIILIKFS